MVAVCERGQFESGESGRPAPRERHNNGRARAEGVCPGERDLCAGGWNVWCDACDAVQRSSHGMHRTMLIMWQLTVRAHTLLSRGVDQLGKTRNLPWPCGMRVAQMRELRRARSVPDLQAAATAQGIVDGSLIIYQSASEQLACAEAASATADCDDDRGGSKAGCCGLG